MADHDRPFAPAGMPPLYVKDPSGRHVMVPNPDYPPCNNYAECECCENGGNMQLTDDERERLGRSYFQWSGLNAVLFAATLAFWLSTIPGTTALMVFIAFAVLETSHEGLDVARAYLAAKAAAL